MSEWIERTMAIEIGDRINKYPILAVTGPRQSGKTTLLKTLFPDYPVRITRKSRSALFCS